MALVVMAQVDKPEDVYVTVTVRMQVKHWRDVVAHLPNDLSDDLSRWHVAQLHDDIQKVISETVRVALRTSWEPEVQANT